MTADEFKSLHEAYANQLLAAGLTVTSRHSRPGISTGKFRENERLIAIYVKATDDVDSPEDFIKRSGLIFPPTLKFRAGPLCTLFYSAPRKARTMDLRLAEGIEVYGGRGCLTYADHILEDVTLTGEVAPAPKWLLERLAQAIVYYQKHDCGSRSSMK
jgi:hypothetical protein